MTSKLLMALALASTAFFPLICNPVSVGRTPVPDYGNSQSGTNDTNITPGSGTYADLFDGTTGSGGFVFNSSLDRLRYIKRIFATPKCINAMKVYASAVNNHGDWIVAATNDGITYVELATITFSGAVAGTEFTWTNTKGYTTYILWQKPGSLISTVPTMREITFKIDDASAYSPPTNVASYAWKYGFLDRSAFITPTTTSTTGGGTLSNLVDGEATDDAAGSWWFGGGQTGRVMKFDFGTAVKLNECTMWQDLTTAQGTWQPAWSDDDSSYTDFGSPVTWGGAALSPGDLSAMPAAHRYVRLTQVSGTTSSSPFQREILFKGSMT